MLTVGLPV